MRFRHNGGDDTTRWYARKNRRLFPAPLRHNPMHNNSRKKSHTMFEFHRNERARQLRPSLSRSWLLVRANSTEEVFEEAFESEADSIIIDLEDGCPPEEKDAAREQVVRMLNSGVVAWVRINAITTEHWWKDVKALKNVKGLRGVMLATAEHATDIDRTAAVRGERHPQRSQVCRPAR